MGPWGGLVTGLAETIEYVATTGVIVFFSAQYANGITSELLGLDLSENMWIWWVILYVAFVALNAAGAAISFRFAIVVSIISIAIILVFAVMAIFSGLFSWDSLWNIVPDEGQSVFLPHGVVPILFALPFAMWFFLGIEALPLAAEESRNPVRDIPKAGLIARATLIVTGLLVLFLNTGILGAEATGLSLEPLLDGFRAMVGDQAAAVLALFALVGLLASLQGIMFSYGRNMYSLSRAGYYPKFLSLTGRTKTPWVALIFGAVLGFIALVVLDVLSRADAEGVGAVAGAIILNIAVWGAVLAYFMQLVSFIILRKKFASAKRPYVSPWGVPGAAVAAVIAALVFLGFLFNPAFTPAIIAIVVVYAVILLGFALWGRHRLVLSPEEEYALSGGLHGDPEVEGYDAMEAEIFKDDPKAEPVGVLASKWERREPGDTGLRREQRPGQGILAGQQVLCARGDDEGSQVGADKCTGARLDGGHVDDRDEPTVGVVAAHAPATPHRDPHTTGCIDRESVRVAVCVGQVDVHTSVVDAVGIEIEDIDALGR